MLTVEIAELVAETLQAEGMEVTVMDGYSGRGMYGKRCVAYVVEGSSHTNALVKIALATARVMMAQAITELGDEMAKDPNDISLESLMDELDKAEEMVPMRSDSLGLGIVCY